jgi:hypothetical protein
MFEGQEEEARDGKVLAMVQGLTLVYALLEESQKGESWCHGLVQGLEKGDPAMNKFKIHNKLLCYQPKGARTKRYVVAEPLSSMLMTYFQYSPLSGHLGALKTWKKVGRQFNWPKLKDDVFQCVRQCDLCQRAKPTQDMKVGLHTATPVAYNLEMIFIDFMGPLVRTKKAYQATLVVIHRFSKIVAFYRCVT